MSKEMMSNSMLFYDLVESGIYKNGHGITCKLPSSEIDRYYIFKAISKRYRRNFKKSKELSLTNLIFRALTNQRI